MGARINKENAFVTDVTIAALIVAIVAAAYGLSVGF